MKIFVMMFVIMCSSLGFAVEKKTEKPRKPSSLDSCQTKVAKAIKDTAKSVGIKEKIEVELSEAESAGKDSLDRPLLKYGSSAFFISEGYLTGSGAVVLVRGGNKTCDIVQMNLTAGAL